MTDEAKDEACFQALFDDELEARIAAEAWWRTPEGRAEIARQEAQIETLFKESEALEAKIEAYIKAQQKR
jgi:cell division protein FtsB